MSKTSLDFGFFCDANQNLKARHFLADLLGNRSLLQWIQKVMVCDLSLVDFDLCLDFGFFCDVNQNLKARHFLADLLGNRSLLQRVQKSWFVI